MTSNLMVLSYIYHGEWDYDDLRSYMPLKLLCWLKLERAASNLGLYIHNQGGPEAEEGVMGKAGRVGSGDKAWSIVACEAAGTKPVQGFNVFI